MKTQILVRNSNTLLKHAECIHASAWKNGQQRGNGRVAACIWAWCHRQPTSQAALTGLRKVNKIMQKLLLLPSLLLASSSPFFLQFQIPSPCPFQMFKAQKNILETACSRKTFYRPPPSISSLRLLRIENSDLRFRSLLPVSK